RAQAVSVPGELGRPAAPAVAPDHTRGRTAPPSRRSVMRALTAILWFARRKPIGAVSGLIVVGMLVMTVFAERIAPYGYDEAVRGARMKPPGAAHWLGTDNLSRDIWSRVVFGARVSVTVGFATIFLGTAAATALGVSSGYFGGKYDLVMQRI